MTFQAVKCDECGRVQGEANHWLKMAVYLRNSVALIVALGSVDENRRLFEEQEDYTIADVIEIHDLCGQGCAVKHIAKLLGWNLPAES